MLIKRHISGGALLDYVIAIVLIVSMLAIIPAVNQALNNRQEQTFEEVKTNAAKDFSNKDLTEESFF